MAKVKQWCKFCGCTFEVKDFTCAVCQAKLDRGATLTVKYSPKKKTRDIQSKNPSDDLYGEIAAALPNLPNAPAPPAPGQPPAVPDEYGN